MAKMFYKWDSFQVSSGLTACFTEHSFQQIVKQSLAKKAERKIVILPRLN
jgi:hypothetical protein